MHTTVHAMRVMEHTARIIRAGMEAPPQEKAHPQMMMAPRNLNEQLFMITAMIRI